MQHDTLGGVMPQFSKNDGSEFLNSDIFQTGTGGFATARSYEGYTIYWFSQQADAELFLVNNRNIAEKRPTRVKYTSAWTDGKWVNTKMMTYVVLIRH